MRIAAVASLLFAGSGGMFCEIRWPDADTPVPSLVMEFIAAECRDHADATGEGWAACADGEKAGYRATVMMLTASATGEKAAERYRACAAGLGAAGGRFHRRKAECIGSTFRYIWRFENTDRA